MDKFITKRENYINALLRLQESLKIEVTDEVIIDGVIQRFEITFELAWKSIREYLMIKGFEEGINSPKGSLQTAYKEGLISEGDIWISMMESRNLTSHLYDYNISRQIYDDIKNKYIPVLKDLKEKLLEV